MPVSACPSVRVFGEEDGALHDKLRTVSARYIPERGHLPKRQFSNFLTPSPCPHLELTYICYKINATSPTISAFP